VHIQYGIKTRIGATTVLALCVVLAIAGCTSVAPDPLTKKELVDQSQADMRKLQAEVPPLSGPLSLEEAIARGLKYNLDRRARMMEEAIALNQLDLSHYDMLPKVLASAGYSTRNKDLVVRSVDSVTGQPSLANPYISQDRTHTVLDLGITWNLLDLGLSYYGAKQQAERVLIASERRRKAMHTLMQDIRTAFWRVAAAQKLREDIEHTIGLGEDALNDSRKLESERLRSPVDALRYQRQLLENLRFLEGIEQELSTSTVELAGLINLPLTSALKVAEPTETVTDELLSIHLPQMEELALAQNADLREQFYNVRIARQETRKTLLRLFPALSFSYNVKYDTDRFLINKQWNEAGVQLSFNLLNLLSGPAQMRLADAGVKLADQRRMATQMAVLTQLHIARQQYANMLRQFQRAQAISEVDDKIYAHMVNRETAETQSKLDRISNQTTAIASRLRRYQALAQVHAAASKLQATIGMEPDLPSVQDTSLADLTRLIAVSMQQWNKGAAPSMPSPSLTR